MLIIYKAFLCTGQTYQGPQIPGQRTQIYPQCMEFRMSRVEILIVNPKEKSTNFCFPSAALTSKLKLEEKDQQTCR